MTYTHTIIDSVAYIVSDEQTVAGDLWLMPDNTILIASGFIPKWADRKKVIAQSSPVHDGLKVFRMEDEAEDGALRFSGGGPTGTKDYYTGLYYGFRQGFTEGRNGMFTREEMEIAMSMAYADGRSEINLRKEEIFQSIQTFEAELVSDGKVMVFKKK